MTKNLRAGEVWSFLTSYSWSPADYLFIKTKNVHKKNCVSVNSRSFNFRPTQDCLDLLWIEINSNFYRTVQCYIGFTVAAPFVTSHFWHTWLLGSLQEPFCCYSIYVCMLWGTPHTIIVSIFVPRPCSVISLVDQASTCVSQDVWSIKGYRDRCATIICT